MANTFNMPKITKEKFRASTLTFLFIIAYVTIFQSLLGPDNTIVGVIFTIMMSASMVRDLTANPIRHLGVQSVILVWIAIAAFLVNVLAPPAAWAVNFITLLVILYSFTYEYSSHMYFPYILSYLFLVFITPVTDIRQLPARMLGMAAGAVSIILYQLFIGRKRVAETARDVLSEMIDDISGYISYRLGQTGVQPDLSDTRHKLCRLSQTVYDRRKKALCIRDASFSMIAAGRGLEHLLILLHELPEPLSDPEKDLFLKTDAQLRIFRSFLHQETSVLPPLSPPDLSGEESKRASELFYRTINYIRDRLLHMSDPQNRVHYPKTALSLKIRLQTALDLSPVRVVYAVRTALLLSCATLLVQFMELPHGKWLLFTLASVSLPYADDVPAKIKKRVIATLIGGIVSVAVYWLVPSPAGRTAVMMLSGYLSFYFSDYTQTFACSTIGALGGAVFMHTFGFQAVGTIFLIRMGYILAGVAIGYAANCLFLPYRRTQATRQLWAKYKTIAGLLGKASSIAPADPQLYYHLVIQAHLLEEKLAANASLEAWPDFPKLLAMYREQIRRAHRPVIAGRADAPVFEAGHLTE